MSLAYSTINRLRLVTPPSGQAVSLDEAKSQLGLIGSGNDEELASNLAIAEAYFDGAEGYLGRALLTQTWDYTFDGGFPYCQELVIPLPPLVSVMSVTYDSTVGVATTLDPTAYAVSGIGGNGSLSVVGSSGWPATSGAVAIRFVAGTDSSHVPLPIKKAIVLKTAQLRALSKADAMLKTDTVFGVASQTWDTSNAGITIYDTAIKSLVARYMDQFV